jgi:hypothetical protein
MATVNAFQIKGLKLWFWSGDHEPPHFHAKKSGEWEIKIFFLLAEQSMIEIKWADKQPSAKIIKKICELSRHNRVLLLEEWERLHSR